MRTRSDLILLVFYILTDITKMALSEPIFQVGRRPQNRLTPKSNSSNNNSFSNKNRNKNNGNKQLIIYDPHTGRQITPAQYLPVFAGNKRKPAKPNGNLVELPRLWNPCACADLVCKCCIGIQYGDNLNHRICIIFEYKITLVTIEVRIEHNNRIVISFGFSARNPPPYCIPILMPFPLFICLRLFDIRIIDGNVNICASLMLNAFVSTIFELHLNCIRFGRNGIQFVKRSPLTDEISSEDDPGTFAKPSANGPSAGGTPDGGGVIIIGNNSTIQQSPQLDENYSGISVEGDRATEVPIRKGTKKG